ncbi:heat shock protein [Basidiobolus meristosporus CBS 931.73]|uniref:Heat shock protein n=1 Tax=Basidiobolus meristosporus CBS 931.73 TaxID=1314790 RepID=A0A1Y1YAU8_9FUNG|nr:heat shock protein [Basidiobolus meristosporus CBS 931.73]|eukprot:ORX95062.1 heat shock protein [Basidiobolus meristosporus CBS 931.73]
MSVVGIDFGSLQSIIAVARNRGIDIVCNEVSNRTTPSLISFGPKQRFLGEAAKTQEVSNFKNTVGSLKRLAGRAFDDQEVQEIESQFINAKLVDVDGQVGVRVRYGESETDFSSTQLVAMYLGKLRDIAAAELKAPVSDVVISVPAWFTDAQRRSILDASEIAGLNCLRLINDTTAAALGYGITKTDLPEEQPRHVVFADCGYSSFTVAVVAFKKGQLTVKSVAFDRHFGGRYFDQVLVDYFAEQFKEKYKIDVKSSPKALFRLRAGCEKLKKVLSANTQAPLNVESIMEDIDVSAMMKREEFEELCKGMLERMEDTLAQAVKDSGLTVEQIDTIEVVGGSTRIPAFKERLSKFFGKDISFTLNQDEAVARGCALQCAVLSPVFKVREFAVQDVTSYPVKFTWTASDSGSESQLEVFSHNNPVPSTKVLTFYRKEAFDVEAYYSNPELLPPGVNPWIGKYSVKNVVPTAEGELSTVKVKARLNVHGIVNVEGAYIAEEIIKEEEEPTPMETDGEKKEENTEAPAPKKVKKIIKKTELPVVGGSTNVDKTVVNKLKELENEMYAADKLVADTEERKNALEEYVYDTRSKLESKFKDYVLPEVKESFSKQLYDTEDWLYDEGEDATKSVYINKLNELKAIGDPIARRFKEHEERPRAARLLRETIEKFAIDVTSNDPRYEHISDEEKKSIVDRCEKAQAWLAEKMDQQSVLTKVQDPVVTSQEILKEREALVFFATPILSKPKPKPEPPKEEAPAAQPEAESKAKTEEAPEMEID